MKDFLPFLIGIALVLLQFYRNFQKEQEKARKRNPSLPGTEAESEAPVPPVKRPVQNTKPSQPQPIRRAWDQRPSSPVPGKEVTPEPVLVKESYDPQRPYEPAYQRDYREPVYERPVKAEKVVRERTATPARVELTHFEDISDETIRNRSIHQPHGHKFERLIHEDEDGGFEFDMRDAVIKQAILNRPEY